MVNPAEVSPVALYTRVFGPEFTDPNAADFKPDPAVIVRRSALSAVDRRSRKASRSRWAPPTRRGSTNISPRCAGWSSSSTCSCKSRRRWQACTVPGKVDETPIGTEIEIVKTNHRLFAGLLAHAVACGQTQVVNVAFADATSSLRRAGGTQTHHEFSHEEPVDAVLGYQPTLAWFFNEIMGSLAFFLSSLDGIKEGDKTLLDRTTIMTATDLGYAKLHGLENMPMMTFGSGGGRLKTGQHIAAAGRPDQPRGPDPAAGDGRARLDLGYRFDADIEDGHRDHGLSIASEELENQMRLVPNPGHRRDRRGRRRSRHVTRYRRPSGAGPEGTVLAYGRARAALDPAFGRHLSSLRKHRRNRPARHCRHPDPGDRRCLCRRSKA